MQPLQPLQLLARRGAVKCAALLKAASPQRNPFCFNDAIAICEQPGREVFVSLYPVRLLQLYNNCKFEVGWIDKVSQSQELGLQEQTEKQLK